MNQLTAEWVEKAEGDFASAGREIRARKAPNHDSTCFHAQQCVEKYMKGILQDASITFPKTHDLSALLVILAPLNPFWSTFAASCATLTDYAVNYRYPGDAATREEAKDAVRICTSIRAFARQELRLSKQVWPWWRAYNLYTDKRR